MIGADVAHELREHPPPPMHRVAGIGLAHRLSVDEAGCLAHLRRYFVDAQETAPLEASIALVCIKRLYDLERRAKSARLSPDARLELRRRESAPIFEELYVWIDEQSLVARPKSPLGVAVRYARNQRALCSRFLEDGRLEVDDNISERELRGRVLGRQNYKFAGSPEGAERAAIHYTLAASCRLHGVDALAWCVDVVRRCAAPGRGALRRSAHRAVAPRLEAARSV